MRYTLSINNIIKASLMLVAVLLMILNLFTYSNKVSAQEAVCSEARLRSLRVAILNCTGEKNCSLPTTTVGLGSVGAGQSIYILGDSITVGASQSYTAKFGEKQITPIINGVVGRSWTSGGSGTSAQSAVQTDSQSIKDAKGIVVALGSNGGLGGNPIADVINSIRTVNPTAPIWWVNTAGTSKWSGTPLTYLGEFNTRLESEAQNRNFRVINWFKEVNPQGDPAVSPTQDPANLIPDGLHPSGEGSEKLANLVVSSVSSNPTGSLDNTSSSGCECSVGSDGPISMVASNNIPQPHKAVIERAASKFSVNPNFVAALFLSEQGNVWKPFDSPWASSNKGASGPFQFMPGTWGQYKEDGNGDGVMDIMNFEDAAFAAAKLAATGTNPSSQVGSLDKPFVPDTLIYFSAVYNWGGGNVQRNTNENSTLSDAPTETQNYMRNIHALITSDFTASGHDKYGPPRLPGQDGPPAGQGGSSGSSSGGVCVSNGTNTALVAKNADEARRIILTSQNMIWGNYGSAASQQQDINSCLTETTLMSIATIAQNSGVKIPVNALATDHGGCTNTDTSRHNHGRAIDIGYYGNNSQGANRHLPDGDTLYKFLYDNREVLQIDELIWQYPPSGYKCIDEGVVGECDTIFSAATMNQHYHHIHVGFKS